MEEILSSIRKIIADDDQPEGGAAPAAVSPNVVDVTDADDDDSFDELDLSFEASAEPASEPTPETHEDVLQALTMPENDSDVFESDDFVSEAFSELEAVSEDESFEALPDLEPESPPSPTYAEKAEAPAYEPVADKIEETVMSKSEPIAAPQTVDAAAGSLGKLLSKVEFGEEAGGQNTIEGVVREMLRPMLKEWLDDNLPAIVEKQVETEVQRIARMAR
ncbi:MAG: pole-organizing protein PopZ [Henriciella sp.]